MSPKIEDATDDTDELDAIDDVPGIEAPRAAPPAGPAPSRAQPTRKDAHLVQRVGDRTVEIFAHLDGARILLDSVEVHGTPDGAQHAFESLLQRLGAEGFLSR